MNDLLLTDSRVDARAAPDDVLLCETRSNHIRWRQGERLHHLFEQICDRLADEGDADHLAVDSDAERLTYRELDEASNRLARHLLAENFGPGDVLALMFDRSALSYVALLAVSKINAAYVPLDPSFPLDRVDFIADDAGVSAILTLEAFADAIADASVPVLALDAASRAIDARSGARLSPAETPEPVSEIAYIIYTSGSTGRPKGVPIEQASICNFLRVAAETYGYDKHDRVYQGLTLAFDFSVEEILVPMMVGATLAPNQSGGSLVGADLAAFLQEKQVTAMCCVPTLLATIETDLPALRLLIVSGEACPQDLVARWCDGTRRMLNAYGPTETTVTCTAQELKPGEPVTIGGPLPTYSAVVLAPGETRALPFGETGELCIGGVGLSSGYLNRDDKTKAAFIEDAIGLPNNPGGKIYRTGDLVRINEIGRIEYLGRIDTQVKIRGYRIELSEIESVIMRSPFVAQAVVDPFEPEPGQKELVAYYTLAEGAEGKDPDEVARAIARQAKDSLPPFMQPAFYEPLDRIPLLPSDKADRKALPTPSRPRLTLASSEHAAPEGPTETAIAEGVAQLLGQQAVSATADFFDELGANSLQMAKLSAFLRDRLGGAEVSMKDAYAHRTVRRLAAFIDQAAKPAPLARSPKPRRGDPRQVALFGAGQVALTLMMGYFALLLMFEALGYIFGAASAMDGAVRTLTASLGLFALAAATPLVAKWVLIGRFREEEFPIWSQQHLRYWFVKRLIRNNPMALTVGSPLYIAYLRALGARVHWDAMIMSGHVPLCTDLITVKAGAIINQEVKYNGYKVEAGMIRTGAVKIGKDAYVGETSVLDIDTELGREAELAHASALLEGQKVKAGRVYHGSPAEPAEGVRYNVMPRARASLRRKAIFTALQLVPGFVLAPLFVYLFFDLVLWADVPTLLTTLKWSYLPYAALFLLAVQIVGLFMVAAIPRLISLFIKKDRAYKLYGLMYILQNYARGASNVQFYNKLFGDSSYIIGYLRWIGYKFKGGVVQTGSNFGLDQKHDAPHLCSIGRGTMVSDGLKMANADFSAGRFKLSETRIGENSFFGNHILYPPESKTGDNVLYATKVMTPTSGEIRQDVGLLGSPPFEIPRSTRRDAELTGFTPEEKAARLRRKNRSNLVTMALFLMRSHLLFLGALSILGVALTGFGMLSPLGFLLAGVGAVLYILAVAIFMDRATLDFGRLKPVECAVLDPYFWGHERHWKLSVIHTVPYFNETPFKGFVLRLAGARVGKRLYDEGGSISEMTLTSIGDDCCINERVEIQGHSLEDAAFKSDHIRIGDNVTLGVSSFVHYGTRLETGALIEADSFLMKGAVAPKRSVWRGNPATILRLRTDSDGVEAGPAGGLLPRMIKPGARTAQLAARRRAA